MAGAPLGRPICGIEAGVADREVVVLAEALPSRLVSGIEVMPRTQQVEIVADAALQLGLGTGALAPHRRADAADNPDSASSSPGEPLRYSNNASSGPDRSFLQ